VKTSMGTVGLAGRLGAALAAALVLALALASPSFAAKKWIFWGAERSHVRSSTCGPGRGRSGGPA
jgi:hypothetical protein